MGLFSTSPEEKARKEAAKKAESKRYAEQLAKEAEARKIAEEKKAKEKRNESRAKRITAEDINPEDYQAVLIEQNFLMLAMLQQLNIAMSGTVGFIAGDMLNNMYKDRMVKFHKEYEK